MTFVNQSTLVMVGFGLQNQEPTIVIDNSVCLVRWWFSVPSGPHITDKQLPL